MNHERFLARVNELRRANARLQQAVSQPETSIVRDAVIQRFEFVFELVWKTLQVYLQHHGLECGSPRATLKKAFAEGLIPSPEEADVWLQMLEDRNLTSHAYDEAVARRIYDRVIRQYAALLNEMSSRIEQLSWN